MSAALAVDGGRPVRDTLLPYARHSVDARDVRAVARALRSDWLTTGPGVERFERAFAERVGAREAVAVSSGTAALHCALHALGVGPGDEVVVPALTFVATASSAVLLGAVPVFADVDPDTLLLDPAAAERAVTPRTRACVAVDYAGQPCDYDALAEVAGSRGLHVVADACHSLGGSDGGRAVGTLAELSAFSLHPVKAVTAGEGGVVTTDDPKLAARMRAFRNHGITVDERKRARAATWVYEVTGIGCNYRLSELQCALAESQLEKLEGWVERRRQIACCYDRAFRGIPEVAPLARRPGAAHAWHLYVVRLRLEQLRVDRGAIFRALRAEGMGVNVHYRPVHLHPFYRERFGTREGQCPVAEAAYAQILSLPLFPGMTPADVESVVAAVRKVVGAYRR